MPLNTEGLSAEATRVIELVAERTIPGYALTERRVRAIGVGQTRDTFIVSVSQHTEGRVTLATLIVAGVAL